MSKIIRMTPEQLRRLKALIKNKCCNFSDGECLLLGCPCPQIITYSLICKWCKNAVLPQNNELYTQLMKPEKSKICPICGIGFLYKSQNKKYCDNCKKTVLRRQKANYQHKYRHRNY